MEPLGGVIICGGSRVIHRLSHPAPRGALLAVNRRANNSSRLAGLLPLMADSFGLLPIGQRTNNDVCTSVRQCVMVGTAAPSLEQRGADSVSNLLDDHQPTCERGAATT
jgi:hypothetical protein